MSDTDQDKPQSPGCFDSESDLPGNSSVDSTIKLGVNVSVLSANQTQVRALGFGDSIIAGAACGCGAVRGGENLYSIINDT